MSLNLFLHRYKDSTLKLSLINFDDSWKNQLTTRLLQLFSYNKSCKIIPTHLTIEGFCRISSKNNEKECIIGT